MSERLLTGWGRTAPSRARVVAAGEVSVIAEALAGAGPRGALARGLGRSYGDAAQNAGGLVLDATALRGPVRLDERDAYLEAPAGVSLGHLARIARRRGFVLPVLPGTAAVTVGGAVAADVHGKNHVRDGSIGDHLKWISLLRADGCLVRAVPGDPVFAATVGGMGLTGVIVAAGLGLLPAGSADLEVEVRRTAELDELLELMRRPDPRRYAVAWVDCLHPAGRGVLELADHFSGPSSSGGGEPAEDPGGRRGWRRAVRLPAPPTLPFSPLRPASVAAFNAAYYHRAPVRRCGLRVAPDPFFHPLDALPGWNRLYGPRGFLQYQFAIPDEATAVLPAVLRGLRRAGAAPFLGVLKRFGAAGRGYLSFPAPGWAFAVDLALGPVGLPGALDAADAMVAEAGGRVYLAKDARLRPDVLAAMYPQLGRWQVERDRLDPGGVLRSDLGRRLGLVGR